MKTKNKRNPKTKKETIKKLSFLQQEKIIMIKGIFL